MLDLDSDRWAVLSHAYGCAGDVPQMMRDLGVEGDDKVWERIWSSLCHQSSVYSATFAAVPHIVAIAEKVDLKGQVMFWAFIGAVAEERGRWDLQPPDEFRADFEEALARSAPTLLDVLKAGVEDERDTLTLLEALAAVRGCVGPARVLNHVADEEVPATCPDCGVELYVSIREDGIFLTTEDPVGHPDADRTWVEGLAVKGPESDIRLEDVRTEDSSVWIPRLARQAGHPALADRLRRLYGNARCPACGHGFPLMDELCRQAAGDLSP